MGIPFIEKFRKLSFQKAENPEDKKKAFYEQNAHNETYKLCVEFAPNQSMPKVIATPDRRTNTIDKDKDYLAYVENLKKEQEKAKETIKLAQESLIRTTVTLINKYPMKKSSKK